MTECQTQLLLSISVNLKLQHVSRDAVNLLHYLVSDGVDKTPRSVSSCQQRQGKGRKLVNTDVSNSEFKQLFKIQHVLFILTY